MERVFKVTTKSNPDPNGLYPSERRYSASIVIGLSIVFLQLSACAMLMGSLIIHKISVINDTDFNVNATGIQNGDLNTTSDDSNSVPVEATSLESSLALSLDKKLEKDILSGYTLHYYIDAPALICAGTFLMAFGAFFSFIAGILAWKRWYIDHNITFFFLFSTFSILTSAISLMLSVFTTINMRFDVLDDHTTHDFTPATDLSPLTMSLAANIIILSILTLIWSIISSRVGYRGMQNTYPDDIMVSKRGKVEVSTVRKGSKNCNTNSLPPQILNNVKNADKISKYLPKKENRSKNNLPKEESNAEYQQRVNKFLAAEPDSANTTENSKV